MNSIGKWLMAGLFLCFIFGFGGWLFISEDRAMSEWENRTLAQAPSFNLKAVANGDFMKNYEAYVTDQFPLRDQWMQAYFKTEQITNQTYVFDYHETDDHYILIKPILEYNEEHHLLSADAMNRLADYVVGLGAEPYFFYLPSRLLALEDMYPIYIDRGVIGEANELFYSNITNDKLTKVHMLEDWKQKYSLDELKTRYYQTDHHWNEEGALDGYGEIHEMLRKTSSHFHDEPFNRDNYEKICAENGQSFLGSYNVQLYNLITEHSDTACHYVSKNADHSAFEIYFGEIGATDPQPVESFFGTKISDDIASTPTLRYADIFAGDYPIVNIVNKARAAEDTHAVIIKDSFVNAITMLLAENYSQTTFVDVRHLNGQTLYDYLEKAEADTVMIMYNNGRLLLELYNFDGAYTGLIE